MQTKLCRDCGECLIRELDFYPNFYRSPVDGRRLVKGWKQPCKRCANRIKAAREKARRLINPAPFRRRSSDYKRRWPERNRARVALGAAIGAGRIPHPTSLPCWDCGKSAHEYDHHLGYDSAHRFDVQPVCRSCHRKRGSLRGEYASTQNGRLSVAPKSVTVVTP